MSRRLQQILTLSPSPLPASCLPCHCLPTAASVASAALGTAHPAAYRYDEKIKDADGFPIEPIAYYYVGEEWRAVSFDESRLDDTTHP